ncbi:PAS domain S-box protein [Alkalihalophilus marmarensis]|uniref:histidine kinase n=1 Tax=Alkalihalophilus marmarensis DSM 21297 TaxID=1188261 RepID=U6STC5_9BACI|nr:PAS domain S-box protein [Alkalihalophilus marmarensis]ERN54637.1 hypothetical protein A33I_04640 [Alkalihalophilus marmarensis DSM 21297]MCM3488742.1 PAS domain S-box protein [Alkalihalophilus marmarensis]
MTEVSFMYTHLYVLSIILSIVIALVAAFTSIDLLEKVYTKKQYFTREFWAVVAAVTLGVGVWSMHFISMLGYNSHHHTQNAISPIILSIVFSILFSSLTLLIIMKSTSYLHSIFGSLSFGVGVSILHYAGLMSMHGGEAVDVFNITQVLVGLISGSILAFIGFRIFRMSIEGTNVTLSHKVVSSILLAASYLAIHYIGMYHFHGHVTTTSHTPSNNSLIVYGITISVLFIFILVIITSYLDRRTVIHAKRMSELHANSLFDSNPNLVCTLDKDGRITKSNHVFSLVTGFSEKELQAQRYMHLFECAYFSTIKQAMETSLEGSTAHYTATLRSKTGKDLFLNVTHIPIKYRNRLLGINVIANDITEHEVMKTQLLSSEMTLKNTIQNIEGFVVKFKKIHGQFIHTYYRGELVDRIGLKEEEVLGRRMDEFLPEDLALKKTTFYNEAWSGKTVHYEGEFNGLRYYMSLKPVMENGQTLEVVGSAINITDREMIKAKFLENEILYRSILTTMTEGVIVIDTDGKVITANEQAAELLHIPYAELIAMNLYQLNRDFIYENGAPFPNENFPCFVTLNTKKAQHNIIMGIRYNRQLSWLSVNTEALFYKGRLSGSVITFSDITVSKQEQNQLKEKNAYLANLIENDPSGIIVINKEREIIYANKLFIKMFSLPISQKDLVGKATHDFLLQYGQMIPNLKSYTVTVEQMIIDEEIVLNEEIKLLDGRVLERDYIPIKDNESLDVHFWKFRDVTYQKQMEQSLRQAVTDAEEGIKAKTDFLSNISHELRTPLNSILGFAQLLLLEKEPPLTGAQVSKVKRIKSSGIHLLNLINDILDLTRTETADSSNFHMEEIELLRFVKQAARNMTPLLKEKELRLIMHMNSYNQYYVLADPTRLRQVIMNLLTNAVKYNVDGGQISIDVFEHNEYIFVKIEDTGVGISIEDQTQIFDHFFRSPLVKDEVEGSGIGLALAKQLIEAMGGKITVTSESGKGSCFMISLPKQ